jgi:hypothetical protein
MIASWLASDSDSSSTSTLAAPSREGCTHSRVVSVWLRGPHRLSSIGGLVGTPGCQFGYMDRAGRHHGPHRLSSGFRV